MQSQESNTGIAGTIAHPDAAEWMAFLYGEATPERRRELNLHLSQCANCTGQVARWRVGMTALDQWKLPAGRPVSNPWLPVLKWAAAVVFVLSAGFILGKQSSTAATELAALKESVAQLEESVRRERGAGFTNSVNAAVAAANAESLRLFSEYALVQESRRASDQQALGLALNNFDSRLTRLRTELETVAVNTETGFEQTHENLTHLAFLSTPAGNGRESSNPPNNP